MSTQLQKLSNIHEYEMTPSLEILQTIMENHHEIFSIRVFCAHPKPMNDEYAMPSRPHADIVFGKTAEDLYKLPFFEIIKTEIARFVECANIDKMAVYFSILVYLCSNRRKYYQFGKFNNNRAVAGRLEYPKWRCENMNDCYIEHKRLNPFVCSQYHQ